MLEMLKEDLHDLIEVESSYSKETCQRHVHPTPRLVFQPNGAAGEPSEKMIVRDRAECALESGRDDKPSRSSCAFGGQVLRAKGSPFRFHVNGSG